MRTLNPKRPYKPVGNRVEILVNEDWRCWFCGTEIGPGTATVAHLLPPKRGGKPERGNLCAACVTCCSQKGGRTLDEFRAAKRREYYPEAEFSHRLRKFMQVGPPPSAAVAERLLAVASDLEAAAPQVTFHGEANGHGVRR